jgi:hypothetical protein
MLRAEKLLRDATKFFARRVEILSEEKNTLKSS